VCPGPNCTLRGALAAAAPGDTIQFSALFNTPQTISLTAGELALDKDVTLQGPGANLLTVSGNQVSRVFLSPGNNTALLSGLAIANGNGVSNSVESSSAFGGAFFIGS